MNSAFPGGPCVKMSEDPRFRKIHGNVPRSLPFGVRKSNSRRSLCLMLSPKSLSSKSIMVDPTLFTQFEKCTASQRRRSDDVSLVSLPTELIPKSVPKKEKTKPKCSEYHSPKAQLVSKIHDKKTDCPAKLVSYAANINDVEIEYIKVPEIEDIRDAKIDDTTDAKIEDTEIYDIDEDSDIIEAQIKVVDYSAMQVQNGPKSFADKNEHGLKDCKVNDIQEVDEIGLIQTKESESHLTLNKQQSKVNKSRSELIYPKYHEFEFCKGNYRYRSCKANRVYGAEPNESTTYAVLYIIALYTICCLFGLSFVAGICWMFTNQVLWSWMGGMLHEEAQPYAITNLCNICYIVIKDAFDWIVTLIIQIVFFLVNGTFQKEENDTWWW